MTFYQELQLNQAGSKNLLKKSETLKEKLYHMWVYLVKIAATMAFCFFFVSIFSILFGNENSIVGVVVLLCLMVFRNADLGIHTGQSTMLLALFFVIMTVCPHLANQFSPVLGMLLNIAALAVLILFGCHNPSMFNQSTLVLGYLLLYGYGNVKKCAVGKYPKSEKHGNTAQFSEVERSGTRENCGGIGSGCRLRLRPLPVLRRRQSQRVARIDPNAVVVDKNIAENDRFDLFSR